MKINLRKVSVMFVVFAWMLMIFQKPISAVQTKSVSHSAWKYDTVYYSNYNVTYYFKLAYIESGQVDECRVYQIKATTTSDIWTVKKVTSSPAVGSKVGKTLKMTVVLVKGASTKTETHSHTMTLKNY